MSQKLMCLQSVGKPGAMYFAFKAIYYYNLFTLDLMLHGVLSANVVVKRLATVQNNCI